MKNKDTKNSTSLPKKHGNDCRISENSNVVPLFTTNTVTDATFRGKGNTPIPSEDAVIEAKSYVDNVHK